MEWTRYALSISLICLLAACQTPPLGPPALPPDVPTTPFASTVTFWIAGPQSVALSQFNVTSSGKVAIVAEWTGASTQLQMELQGRRRTALPDPTEPYAVVTGASPLELTYDVKAEDLARGVTWRIVLRDPATGHDARGTLQITKPINADRERDFRAGRLGLRAGDMWPSPWLQFQFLAGLNTAPAGALHALVTLNKACNCKENQLLERQGVSLLKHLPNRHALARVERGFVPSPESFVAGITPLEPEDKIEPNILVGNYAKYVVAPDVGAPTNMVFAGAGLLNLTVTFFDDVDANRIRQVFLAEGVTPVRLSDAHWQVNLPQSRLRVLATYDEVEAIDVGPAPPMADNDNSRVLINAAALQNATINATGPTITYAGATGLGITVGVQDKNIDATHPDLNVVATISPDVAGSHGTHVAGTIAGSGVQSTGTNVAGTANGGTAFQWRGVAPRAALISSGNLDTTGSMRTAINSNSLDVTNRSQSISFDGDYDAENSRIDSLIAGSAEDGDTRVPARLLVTSAGNHAASPGNQSPANGGTFGSTTTVAGQTGYFSITKQMKNAVVVGNQSSFAGAATVALAASSSLGPTYDGRIRPDVLALGTFIKSTGTVGDGNSCVTAGNDQSGGYAFCTGTSMATPAITGGVAQLLELWQNTYNAPIGANLDANPPLPSLLRALLIQSATDVVQNDVRNQASPDLDLDSNASNGNDGQGRVPATVGPDYATGWGTANIGAAATILQDTRSVSGRAQANRLVQSSIFQGGIREYDFVVNQAGPVRVTLAWDDFEATTLNPATSPMLVNDLDLELQAPDGTVFFPWRLGHTVNDPSGNPLADAAQVPGTAIQVQIPIAPITNPSFQWLYVCQGGGMPPCTTTAQSVAPVNVDNIPVDAVDGNGTNDVWVATIGKDHLNNVEQVLTNVPATPTQFGHWKARVIGFNVREDTQSFSLVGFPYPALAELVPSSTDRVSLNAFGTPISFNWQVQNTGTVGTGVGFTHQVFLSTDFALGGDVPLTDTAAVFSPLAAGATATRTSTVTITAADAQALLGNPAATIDDLIKADVFLLIRADSGDAVLEHNDVNLLAVQLARPVDVVAVLDRSGSMSADVPITAGTQTKLQMLQDSARLFVDMLRRDAGDRLGQVSFASNVSTDFDDGAGAVKPYGAAETATVKSAIDSLSADGNTNIRAALERALSLIPASTDRRKVVLFFSDGMKTAGGNPTEASFLQRFTDEDVNVFSVGFGTEGGDGLSGLDIGLLQKLADANAGGFFHVTQSGLELDKFLVNALANAVSAEVIVDPVETLAPGATTDVVIDAANPDRVVTFVLTWDNPAFDPVFELVSPEGIVLNSGNIPRFSDAITRIDAAAHSLVQVNLPLRVGTNQIHAGQWRMRVRNPTNKNIRFAATAITESETVEATTIEPPADGIFDLGEPITLKTAMRTSDGPITDAQITVRVDMPVASLGNVLASAGLTQAEINATPSVIANEPVDQLRRMTIALTRRLGRDPVGRVTVTGSGKADPAVEGAYTTRFPSTRVPGVYTFTTRAQATLKECDQTTRESVTSAYVPPKTDPRRTPIRVVSGGGRVTVTLTPQDVAGNYIGPGLGEQIVIRAEGLTPAATTIDRLDGSYQQIFLRVAGTRMATIHAKVLDIDLPPQRVLLDAPTGTGLTVPVGTTTGATRTRLQLNDGASAAAIRGVALTRAGVATPARSFRFDQAANAVDFVVPANLASGEYDVVIIAPEGAGPVTEGVVFRVVEGKKPPAYIAAIDSALTAISMAGDSTGEQRQSLLAALRDAVLDAKVTAEMKQAALKETVDLLSRDGAPVSRSTLPAIDRFLSAAQGSMPKVKP